MNHRWWREGGVIGHGGACLRLPRPTPVPALMYELYWHRCWAGNQGEPLTIRQIQGGCRFPWIILLQTSACVSCRTPCNRRNRSLMNLLRWGGGRKVPSPTSNHPSTPAKDHVVSALNCTAKLKSLSVWGWINIFYLLCEQQYVVAERLYVLFLQLYGTNDAWVSEIRQFFLRWITFTKAGHQADELKP